MNEISNQTPNSFSKNSPIFKVSPGQNKKYSIRQSTFTNKVRHFSINENPNPPKNRNIIQDNDSIEILNTSNLKNQSLKVPPKSMPRKSYYHPQTLQPTTTKTISQNITASE
jgi:hypothetical protein